jgi:4-alpha-glucanotransferase
MKSVANTVLFPMQDVLGLGSEARMNTPGTLGGNWTWRLRADDLREADQCRLKLFTEIYDR